MELDKLLGVYRLWKAHEKIDKFEASTYAEPISMSLAKFVGTHTRGRVPAFL